MRSKRLAIGKIYQRIGYKNQITVVKISTGVVGYESQGLQEGMSGEPF